MSVEVVFEHSPISLHELEIGQPFRRPSDNVHFFKTNQIGSRTEGSTTIPTVLCVAFCDRFQVHFIDRECKVIPLSVLIVVK